jgi:hypothetical protein
MSSLMYTNIALGLACMRSWVWSPAHKKKTKIITCLETIFFELLLIKSEWTSDQWKVNIEQYFVAVGTWNGLSDCNSYALKDGMVWREKHIWLTFWLLALSQFCSLENKNGKLIWSSNRYLLVLFILYLALEYQCAYY